MLNHKRRDFMDDMAHIPLFKLFDVGDSIPVTTRPITLYFF